MRKLVLAAIAATTFISAPALASGDGRIGVRASYDSADGEIENLSANIAEGAGFGVVAGYDVPVGPIFVGVEVSADLSTADKSIGGFDVKLGREFAGVARVSVNATPDLKLFGVIGVANREIEIDDESGDDEGSVWGLGAQYNVGSKIYATAEFRKTEFNFDDTTDGSTSRFMVGAGMRF